jgi:glycosyltransferase involved in cell wall biosynthesis
MYNKKDLISVIVPVYNIKEYLERCVDSILAQTWENLEILLVDDGSFDGTELLADELGKRDGRIRVFHKENGGSSSARNLGIREARGAYLGFVDSDDYIEPFMYERLYRAIKETGMPVAQGGRREIDERGNFLPDICIPPEEQVVYNGKDFMRELLLHKGDCSFCTKLTDVSLFKGRETGRCVLSGDRNKEQSACEAYCADTGEFPEGKLNEDFHVLVRMLPEIEGIVSVPERVYNVFYKSGSNTRTGSEANFSRVYGDNVDNADMVTELVREYYPELEKTAQRFGLYQRLDYMLHIPIGEMKKENRQYVEIVRYLKKNRAEICRNRELAKKEKLYLLLFSMMPATIRKVHRFVRSRRWLIFCCGQQDSSGLL